MTSQVWTGSGPSMAAPEDDDATAGGGITRVHAFDGLFLRAEHLERMQDYARELACAVGAAGGDGVVWGYGLALDGTTLQVDPGLAIDSGGRPLRATEPMSVDLSDLELSPERYIVVAVTRASWPFGQEAVQGVLCDDPCSGGSSARPYVAEGVAVTTTTLVDGPLAAVQADDRRSWLASRLYAAERVASDGWPAQGGAGLFDRDWHPGGAPDGAPPGVPLGVLIPGDGEWILDTWAARRDRDATPPTSTWQWRLGMRPWSVFVAQVLQLQAQLGELLGAGSALSRASYLEDLIGRLDGIGDQIMKRNRKETLEDVDELSRAVRTGGLGQAIAMAAVPPLVSMGIGELPPAGFLPVLGAGTREGVGEAVREQLGGASDVRVCVGRIGDVGGFLAGAQHRERIPLDRKGRDAVVDVLWVEDSQSDWVAFVRRDGLDCGSAAAPLVTEPVEVHVVDIETQRSEHAAWRRYLEDPGPEGPPPLTGPGVIVDYPVRTWALPEGDAYATVVRLLAKLAEDDREVRAVAVVRDEVRRPLGVARTMLLTVQCTESDTELEVRVVSAVGPTEAVVLLVGDREG